MLTVLSLLFVCLHQADAQDTQSGEIISRIEIEGSKRIPAETVLTYVTLEEGDRFDERVLRNDFRALWNTGFFSDIKILRRSDADGGVVVTIVVVERPLVREVVYEGLKSVSKKTVEEKMDEQSVEIPLNSPLDLQGVSKVLAIIREQMEEKGLEFGDVSYELREVSPIEVDLVFKVREGGKVKIKEVRFVGNEHFSQWELTRVLEKSRPTWLFSWVQKDNIYSSKLLEQDRAALEKFYADHGFLRVNVKDPQIETVEVDPLLGGKHTQVVITIPVSEGMRYSVNEINFTGADLLPEQIMAAMFKLKEGELYNRKAIEDSTKEITELYNSRGYIDAFIQDSISYIPDKVGYVDLDISVQEGDPYIISSIEFEGNRTTRDKVLRRNIFLFEQQPFSLNGFKDSMRRLEQLGFFGSVDFELNPNREDKTIDLKFKVTETGRNQIQFGGGYSGIEGAFVNLMFSTSNFWGQGQRLSFMVQTGGRNDNYSVSFFDPWLFDRPLGAGVTFFSRSFEFADFVRKGQGGTANFSYRLARFLSAFLEYRYELVEIRNPEDYFFTQSLFFPEGRTATGSVTPTLVRDTVDHPFLPSRGHKDTISLEYGAPFFGGDFSFLKLRVEHISNIPLTSRNILRFRGQIGYAKLLGETKQLPVFERFFMGGEFTLRGYELRTVGPRDEFGRIIGGTSSLLFNFEYVFKITNEIRVAPFVDAGNAYTGPIDINDLHYSAGVEMTFFVPVMNIPFRFIFSRPINPKEFHRTNPFHFTIGVMF